MNELKHPNIVQFRRVCLAPCALTGRPLYVFVFMKRIYEGYEQSSENCTFKSRLGLNIPVWCFFAFLGCLKCLIAKLLLAGLPFLS